MTKTRKAQKLSTDDRVRCTVYGQTFEGTVVRAEGVGTYASQRRGATLVLVAFDGRPATMLDTRYLQKI
jgi:hypothetical protein